MSIPPGKSILVLSLLAVITGLVIAFRAPNPGADLKLWVFADCHARMYRGDFAGASAVSSKSLLQQFQDETGKSVELDLIATPALDVRLISLFMSASNTDAAPDLAEIEIGSIGKYFRAPASDVGFIPLNNYLEKSGWLHRIAPARFAPWSKGSIIFGIPDDLHPCTITFRKDLFDQASIDLAAAKTWPDFQTRCLQFQQYWHSQGIQRTAIGLSSSTADAIIILLEQQHLNLIDPDLTVHLADDKVLNTLLWYAQAVAGPKKIATDFTPAPGQNVRDLARGDICAMITPDWQLGDLHQFGPDLAGKLHMIPLPRFSADDAPTASWGGTMIGITRACKQPDLAWKLIEKLYLDRAALNVRQAATDILPPIPQYWSDPVYQKPDPLYGNQKVDQLFLTLAPQLPPRYTTPYSMAAQTLLAVILNAAVQHVQRNGNIGLEISLRKWLNDASQILKENIEFDQPDKSRTFMPTSIDR